jgi:hypothetical protein
MVNLLNKWKPKVNLYIEGWLQKYSNLYEIKKDLQQFCCQPSILFHSTL